MSYHNNSNNNSPCNYGLNKPCRVISSIMGDSDHHRFIVGTSNIKEEENEVI